MKSDNVLPIILVIGGGAVLLLWNDISSLLGFGDDHNNTKKKKNNNDDDDKCDITLNQYIDYYASRVAEEVSKNTKKISKDKLKAYALRNGKELFGDMYFINGHCITSLEGSALKEFIKAIVTTADSFGIQISDSALKKYQQDLKKSRKAINVQDLSTYYHQVGGSSNRLAIK